MTTSRFGAYGVTYTLGPKTVLDAVSFEMGGTSDGEVLALFGPNGAGKSSLLKVLCGIIPVTSVGHARVSALVRFRGEELSRKDLSQRARMITYVGAELRAEFPITAEEAVMMGRLCHHPKFNVEYSDRDANIVRAAMERTLCWSLKDRDLGTLSGGEKQLVALARAIAQESKVLVLDEALSRMDLHHQARMGSLIRELAREGRNIILVSHDVNLAAEWADTGLLIVNGLRKAAGPIRDVMTEENFRVAYPDAKLHVGKNPVTGAPQIFFGG